MMKTNKKNITDVLNINNMDETSQDLYKFLYNTTDNNTTDNMNNNLDSPKSNTSDESNISPPRKKKKQVKPSVEHVKNIMKRMRNMYEI